MSQPLPATDFPQYPVVIAIILFKGGSKTKLEMFFCSLLSENTVEYFCDNYEYLVS